MSDTETMERQEPSTDGNESERRSFLFSEEMPPPYLAVKEADGSYMPAMFFYACEQCDPFEIAKSHGFKMMTMRLEHDPEASSLWEAYGRGESVLTKWQPPQLPGWFLCGLTDTENGPCAIYLTESDDANSDANGAEEQSS